ncbi:MAG: exodeoxyribonuclease V subunit beta [Planctomycetes bacterium]|nr:exodeoxyribonuclease V subunit beta [Planctomycetota bacterium]
MKAQTLDLSQKPQQGTVLIEASAGTGKTYSIASLYLHFILAGKKCEEILVVTFTEEATMELKERIRTRLSESLTYFSEQVPAKPDTVLVSLLSGYAKEESQHRLKRALLNFDRASIFTIHAFCRRNLQVNAFESTALFQLDILTSTDEILERSCRDYLRHLDYGPRAQENIPLPVPELAKLKEIGKQILKHPNLILEPKLEAGWSMSDMGQILEDFSAQAKSAMADYDAKKEEIDHFLFLSGKLSKTKYHPERGPNNILKWQRTLELTITHPHDLAHHKDCDKELSFLCFENISGALKKNFDDSHICCADFFQQCSLLMEQLPKLKLCLMHLSMQSYEDFRQYLQQRVTREKELLSQLSFDDLIQKFHRALMGTGSAELLRRLRESYTVALVDEFQDTDSHQYDIFRKIFHEADYPFYMIGDPKQAIYSFRGADIHSYLEAKAESATQYTLKHNYRSDPALVQAVNQLFLQRGSDAAFAFAQSESREGITYEDVEGKADRGHMLVDGQREPCLQMHWVHSGDAKALSKENMDKKCVNLVAEEITQLLTFSEQGQCVIGAKSSEDSQGHEEHKVQASDIAVLCLSHRQIKATAEALALRGVPYVINQSGNVFHSQEATALAYWMRAVISPHEERIRPVLCYLLNYKAENLIELSETRMQEISADFSLYRKIWHNSGPLSALWEFMSQYPLRASLLQKKGGERALCNINHLAEILHREAQRGKGPEDLLHWFKVQQSSDDENEEYLQRLESDANAVQLMTIHKSKGLEFPIVFCPYLWHKEFTLGRMHKANAFEFSRQSAKGPERCLHVIKDDDQRETHDALRGEQSLQETLRLIYVALTRAIYRTSVYLGEHTSLETSSLSWLFSPKAQLPPKEMARAPEVWQNIKGWHESLDDSLRLNISVAETTYSSDDQLPCHSYHPQLKEEQKLSAVSPSLAKQPEWRVGSFSAMTYSSHTSHANKAFQQLGQAANADQDDQSSNRDQERASGFLGFPRGAKVGLLIHEIFENSHFQDQSGWQEVIEACLIKYKFHGENQQRDTLLKKRTQDIYAMLEKTIGANYSGFKLSELREEDIKKEMEFYFRLKNISPDGLAKVFKKHSIDSLASDYSESLKQLHFFFREGHMHGYMDMVFRQSGKTYILDWKSNDLGQSSEDYGIETLTATMTDHHYILQAIIYSLALHLLLKRRMPNYDYDRDFGGYYYVFVRGTQEGQNSGIYHSKPTKALIEDLERIWVAGEDNSC